MPRKNHRPTHHKGGHSKGRSHSHIKKAAVGRQDLAGAAHGFAAKLVARGLRVAQIIDTPRPAATVVARVTRTDETIREGLQERGQLDHADERTDSLGRQQPAQPVPKPPVKEVCKRHPNGPTSEPCRTCYQVRRRAEREQFGDVCRRHPNGDTGEPCGRCANIRRRRQEEQRSE